MTVGTAGQVGDDDVGVEVRIGTVAVIGAFGRPRSDMVEAGRHDVFGYNPFAAAPLARECVALKLGKRTSWSYPGSLDGVGLAVKVLRW